MGESWKHMVYQEFPFQDSWKYMVYHSKSRVAEKNIRFREMLAWLKTKYPGIETISQATRKCSYHTNIAALGETILNFG